MIWFVREKNPSGIVKIWNKTHSMFVGQNVKQVQDTKQFKHFFLHIKPKVNRHHNKTGDKRIGAYALPCFTKIRYSYGGRFVQFRFCRCKIMIIFVFSPRNNDKITRNNETNKKALISTTITINFVISEWSRKDANLHLFVFSLFLGEVEKR